MEFLDFDLLIERSDEPNRYKARVLRSPAGEAMVEFTRPFEPLEVENFILKAGLPRSGVRGLGNEVTDTARTFGSRLFERVFHDEVGARFDASRMAAEAEQKGIRLRLRLGDVPELGQIPWEYLYDKTDASFVALNVESPLVRYLDVPGPCEPLLLAPPLRILAVVSSPHDLAELDVEAERRRLTEAVGVLGSQVDLRFVDDAQVPTVQQEIRQFEPHVLHFIGHGGYDEREAEGILMFEDEQGRGRAVTAERFSTLLQGRDSLRLVVLNACEGARGSATDPFAGVAQSLVRRRLPAIIAMQFPISDTAAIAFARELYRALAEGCPVDNACTEARIGVYANGNDIEWGTPVLYLRAPDGRLFTIDETAPTAAAAPVTAAAPAAPLEATAPVAPALPPVAPALPPVAPAAPRRRRPWVIVGVTAAAVVALAVFLLWLAGGDGAGDAERGAAPVTACGSCELRAVPAQSGTVPDDAPTFVSDALVFTNASNPASAAEITALSAAWQLAWDDTGLYVHVSVRDLGFDRAWPDGEPTQSWKGDSANFEFGVDPTGLDSSTLLRTGDRHVLLAPPAAGHVAVPAAANVAIGGLMKTGHAEPAIKATANVGADGYEVDAFVPWSVLGVPAPAPGQIFGMNVNVSEAGVNDLAAMKSNNPGRQQDRPATWTRLVLTA